MNLQSPRLSSLVTSDPRQIAEAIEEFVEHASRTVTYAIHDNLIADPRNGGTPRLTGFASASWICSVGEPSRDVAGSQSQVDVSPSREGRLKVHQYRLHEGCIFIANNTEYILQLAYTGPSTGFVDAAVIKGVNSLEFELT